MPSSCGTSGSDILLFLCLSVAASFLLQLPDRLLCYLHLRHWQSNGQGLVDASTFTAYCFWMQKTPWCGFLIPFSFVTLFSSLLQVIGEIPHLFQWMMRKYVDVCHRYHWSLCYEAGISRRCRPDPRGSFAQQNRHLVFQVVWRFISLMTSHSQ